MNSHSVEKTSAKAFKEKVEVALDLGCHIGVTSELFQEMIKRIEELEANEAADIVRKASIEHSLSAVLKELEEKNNQLTMAKANWKACLDDYTKRSKDLTNIAKKVEQLAMALDRQAVRIYKIRDSGKTVMIEDTEVFMMDKAKDLRMFLLMNELI
jgi:hypothetical protein